MTAAYFTEADIIRALDAEAGKIEKFDLLAYPLVKAELESRIIRNNSSESRLFIVAREMFAASGPIIVSESTGRPWSAPRFRAAWRKIARKAGIPDNVQNRDSRAGAATEADLADAPREKVKRMLGHSNEATTAGYQRESMAIRSEIARARAEKRK